MVLWYSRQVSCLLQTFISEKGEYLQSVQRLGNIMFYWVTTTILAMLWSWQFSQWNLCAISGYHGTWEAQDAPLPSHPLPQTWELLSHTLLIVKWPKPSNIYTLAGSTVLMFHWSLKFSDQPLVQLQVTVTVTVPCWASDTWCETWFTFTS